MAGVRLLREGKRVFVHAWVCEREGERERVKETEERVREEGWCDKQTGR